MSPHQIFSADVPTPLEVVYFLVGVQLLDIDYVVSGSPKAVPRVEIRGSSLMESSVSKDIDYTNVGICLVNFVY